MTGVTVTAIDRVIDIFEAFQNSQQPLSLTELAEAVEVPKSTCHAIVSTLTARGYLYTLSRPRALYPTRRMYDVMHDISRNDPFIRRATPVLERLRDATRETIILGKRQGDLVIYLQVVEGLNSIRYSAKPGEFKPLHSSSIGKALLGSLKEKDLRAWLKERKLNAITATTKVEHETLVQDVLASRKAGYFVTRGENVSDVWAVATFINVHGETLAVAVAGPQHRIEANLEEMARLLIASCSFLSRQLVQHQGDESEKR
ncbi:IclR family transcriptional regulator [Alicycliphilus denitrificans]|uniref:IclR family transcriptional regulator n=1 Tax=Alicycliphilus denitrificans TaxID=179636 RepID=A0A858ZZ87_9BURK|nr:IclR family transcriptional regulator [Alicycliphilus denitrificans]QKD46004.1 IclR family transcriptional regulator [Alicycliphilus denitrificans]